MEEQKKTHKRSIIFIKKEMQLKFVVLFLLLALFCVLMTIYEVISLSHAVFAEHPVLLQELLEQSAHHIPITLIKIVIFFSVIAIFAALLSNKFAGPLYRFENVCREIAKGNYKIRVKLREGDAMRGLEKEFNTMLCALEKREGEKDEISK